MESWDVRVLQIVFLIFKIIGAMLGIILGILLLIILLFLLVPIRYQVNVENKRDVKITEAYVHWLLRIVHFKVIYEKQQFKYCLRIFGIPVKQNISEKKPRERKSREKKKKKAVNTSSKYDKIKDKKAARQMPKEISEETEEKTNLELVEKNKQEDNQDIKKQSNVMIDRKKTKLKKSGKRFSLIKWFQTFWGKIKEKFQSLKEKIRNAKDTIKSLIDKKQRIFLFLKKENTKNFVRNARKSVLSILKYMGPQRIYGTITYGMEDPGQTGISLGMLSIVYAYYTKKNRRFKIIPDFEHKIFEAHLQVKGRFRLIRLLFISLKLILNKGFKTFMNDVKMLKEEF